MEIFFRAVSNNLCDNERKHCELRKAASIDFMDKILATTTTSNINSICSFIRYYITTIGLNGTWIGEDVIFATAKYLQREINVFSLHR